MRFALVVTALLVLTSCGYIGPPEYPALNIPARVADLGAIERGDHLDISFTLPTLTTEGLVVKSIGPIDLRVGPSPQPEFHIEPWAEGATKVEVKSPEKPGPVQARVDISKFAGQEVIVAVRIASPKGRYSEWSNLATVRVGPPVGKPAGFAAENTAKGVWLTWKGSGASSFRVYRSSDKEPQPALVATVPDQTFLDTTTAFGTKYEYFVQGTSGDAESEAAGPITITPKDDFPPAVPSGLAATAGLNSIELNWDRSPEPDFQGYRVYRAPQEGPFERVADLIEAPNYSDRKIESGKRYRYAISAVDRSGNESEKSAPIEVTAP